MVSRAVLWLLLVLATLHARAALADPRRVIVFVWDGMRPDAVSQEDTPNLVALARRGTWFNDHHSSYPPITMINAMAFATGARPGPAGFYGNRLWPPRELDPRLTPGVSNTNGDSVRFRNVVFVEDDHVLRGLDAGSKGTLIEVPLLFAVAKRAGLKTAAIGKTGATFLQDYGLPTHGDPATGGLLLDERLVLPLAFARELQQAGVHLPRTAPSAFARDELVLAPDNGDPTARSRYFMLRDSVTSDATATGDTPPAAANAWMVDVYLNEVLRHTPDLTVLWLRNPDSTQHAYGVGSPEFHSALREQDALLGRVVARLDSLGMSATTDVIVVSDHGHSNIAGARDLFPLRQIQGGDVGGVDNEHGYSVSGSIRMAHELTTIARIPAFDGQGALYTPVMSGIRADGSRLVPARHDDAGGRPRTYTTPGYVVPDSLPQGALVLAPNGGTEYFYQPEHDVEVVKRAVRFLQSREYVAAVFVAARYGSLPGTLPAASVDLENASRGPDIIVSYTWNDAKIQGFPGTEYSTTFADVPNERGEHGSFSPYDIHNTLVAAGPDFRAGWRDPLPSGNVDVAPTIAALLHLDLPPAQGRVLREALRGGLGEAAKDFRVTPGQLRPSQAATGLETVRIDGSRLGATRFSFSVHVKDVKSPDGGTWRYYDFARPDRH